MNCTKRSSLSRSSTDSLKKKSGLKPRTSDIVTLIEKENEGVDNDSKIAITPTVPMSKCISQNSLPTGSTQRRSALKPRTSSQLNQQSILNEDVEDDVRAQVTDSLDENDVQDAEYWETLATKHGEELDKVLEENYKLKEVIESLESETEEMVSVLRHIYGNESDDNDRTNDDVEPSNQEVKEENEGSGKDINVPTTLTALDIKWMTGEKLTDAEYAECQKGLAISRKEQLDKCLEENVKLKEEHEILDALYKQLWSRIQKMFKDELADDSNADNVNPAF